jgi:hypothetical protein
VIWVNPPYAAQRATFLTGLAPGIGLRPAKWVTTKIVAADQLVATFADRGRLKFF